MSLNGWHSYELQQVFTELDSSEKGLSGKNASQRLEAEGKNVLESKSRVTPLQILLGQFKDFLIILLIAAAFISIAVGVHEKSVQEIVEAGLILLIVVFIVIVGFYQQYHAEKELEALKNLVTPVATILRDGAKKQVDAENLVLGDIVFLESGDRVPADLRIINSVDLKADESSLTGESTPVEKKQCVIDLETPLAERVNSLYMGTTIVYGKATAIVVSKGMDTELGKIAKDISQIREDKTPLQERLNVLGKQIGVAVIILCAIVFASGYIASDTPVLELFIIAIALAVAAVPEGLPGVVTVALATGTRRMVRHNAIIRKLPAVETLGCTTVICSDKTGTLTRNEMTVKKAFAGWKTYDVEGQGYAVEGGFTGPDGNRISGPNVDLERFAQISLLCNDSSLTKEGEITGDPTEASILVAAEKLGYSQKQLNEKHPRVDEIPFSSERKRMTTIHDFQGQKIAFTKGAPDVILDLCAKILVDGEEKNLAEKDRKEILGKNSEFASQAFRVLGLAYRPIPDGYDHQTLEKNLVFTGLAAMIDPPRKESADAVQECRNAGIRAVMITGDHMLTAKAIAEQLGIFREGDLALTGAEIDGLDDEQMKDAVEKAAVYARVSPSHKLRIVEALQSLGNVVAMTGDGVNDAPALKKADIGVAMGVAGTDVSKEAADMVLTDDNFSSIVSAVEEGRGIYDNIRKFFAYLISGNIGEVGVVFLSSIIPGVPIALTATQILIINLVTDGLPALALGVDPFEPGAMKQKPRSRREPLHRGLSPFIVWYPLLMITVTMGLFLWVFDPVKQNVFEAQTVAFISIAFFEMYQAFASRSTRFPALKVGIFTNKWLNLAVLLSFAVVLCLLYLPLTVPFVGTTLQDLMHTTPLPASMFAGIILLSSVGFIYLEIQKWWNTRKIDIILN